MTNFDDFLNEQLKDEEFKKVQEEIDSRKQSKSHFKN